MSVLDKLTSPRELLIRYLGVRLDEMGCSLTDPKLQTLVDAVLNHDGNTLSVELDLEDFGCESIRTEQDLKEVLERAFTGLPQELDLLLGSLEEVVDEAVNETSSKLSLNLVDDYLQYLPQILSENQSKRSQFLDELNDVWGKSLNLLEAHTTFAQSVSSHFFNTYRKHNEFKKSKLLDAIFRLQARAFKTANEILSLLRNGFADGAHARWRSLHELTVITIYLSEGSEDLAERYMLHEHIDAYKSARRFYQRRELIRWSSDDQKQYEYLEEKRRSLQSKYGQNYDADYGWAAEHFGKPKPTFLDIEKAVEMGHYRPYYHLAGLNIHANARSLFHSLGMPDQEDAILAGPSLMGLADPAHSAALSIAQISSVFVNLKKGPEPTFDYIVAVKFLAQFAERIGRVLEIANKKLVPPEHELKPSIRRKLKPTRRPIKRRR